LLMVFDFVSNPGAKTHGCSTSQSSPTHFLEDMEY
jgi:hypothetical protein